MVSSSKDWTCLVKSRLFGQVSFGITVQHPWGDTETAETPEPSVAATVVCWPLSWSELWGGCGWEEDGGSWGVRPETPVDSTEGGCSSDGKA
ncbi:hypothetical protein P7K49_035121 [Saguinus oedipus]|uniref:Uncharacterized protein n=1 Tax=Saguinus oedipus TaxID=9490 RepID=A0ABQ9TXC9_SAGOE|nr:hypothetical protein P7K49_035121 [Saguinus oedipus]